jgi:amino acid transporter
MPQVQSQPQTTSSPPAGGDLRRVLTYWDAVALIAGIMIGSGIFATPPQIAASLDRFGPMISVWLLGGLLALCGALTYAELAAMYPRTGGSFVFLREAYGRPPAFVYGWSALLITYPASVAAVAVVFAAYLKRLAPGIPIPESVIAAGLALFACGLNMLGVVFGARVQRTFTAAKVGALVSLVVFAIFATEGQFAHLTPIWAAPSGGWQVGAFALAMASVMWTYEGWADGPTLSGEVKDIRRDLPRALIIGTGVVTIVYILVNASYVYVLSIPGIAASSSVAVDMAEHTMGQFGGLFVNLLVIASTAGSVNGMVIAGSRVSFAMARECLFFESVGRVHPRLQTPANALAILGVVSATYCLLGTFDQLIRYFVFVAMIWFIMNILAVFVLRARAPRLDRPFRVPLYPMTPAIFLVVALGLMYQLFHENPRDSVIGLFIIAVSFPAYGLWRRFYCK